jgi:hypothetical protein
MMYKTAYRKVKPNDETKFKKQVDESLWMRLLSNV